MGLRSIARVAAGVLILAITLGIVAARADPIVIEGRAEVIDGATIEIWGQRIRLAGIVVPDPNSTDGKAGKRFLQDLLADIRVRCRVEDPSFPFGLSGRCFAADVDISGRLVQMGYARRVRR